jgi:hypothetical protein
LLPPNTSHRSFRMTGAIFIVLAFVGCPLGTAGGFDRPASSDIALPSPTDHPTLPDMNANSEPAILSATTSKDQPLFIPTQPEELFEGSTGSVSNENEAAVGESMSIPAPDALVPEGSWSEVPSTPQVYSGSSRQPASRTTERTSPAGHGCREVVRISAG